MPNNKPVFLGVDTSNYTTSLAAVSMDGEVLANVKCPLKVAPGGRGLRQSDAVFEHVKNLPLAIQRLREETEIGKIAAIGYSEKPRNAEGAYMPCFLPGVAAAQSMALGSGAVTYAFAHQDGHIRAACHSAGFTHTGRFAAFHVSGGTTELLLVDTEDNTLKVTLFGETKDLNAGQLVDRIGVRMGLPFPCGAAMDALALENREKLPPVKVCVKGADCNLSGAENLAASILEKGGDKALACAYTFEFVAKTLIKMTEFLRSQYPDIPVIYAGGVMGSKYIKGRLNFKNAYFAEPALSADNAVGVALLAYEKYVAENGKI